MGTSRLGCFGFSDLVARLVELHSRSYVGMVPIQIRGAVLQNSTNQNALRDIAEKLGMHMSPERRGLMCRRIAACQCDRLAIARRQKIRITGRLEAAMLRTNEPHLWQRLSASQPSAVTMTNQRVHRVMSRAGAPVEALSHSASEQRSARLALGRVVIVCGGRQYQYRNRVFSALDLAHSQEEITLLVHGAYASPNTGKLLGTDRWADEWAQERGVAIEGHPADWLTWGRTAVSKRNREMVEAGAHTCIVFPGGRGTAAMIAVARASGMPVWQPYP